MFGRHFWASHPALPRARDPIPIYSSFSSFSRKPAKPSFSSSPTILETSPGRIFCCRVQFSFLLSFFLGLILSSRALARVCGKSWGAKFGILMGEFRIVSTNAHALSGIPASCVSRIKMGALVPSQKCRVESCHDSNHQVKFWHVAICLVFMQLVCLQST